MGSQEIILIAIPLMVLATQAARLGPLFFPRLHESKALSSWLGQVPIAVLTTLVLPEFVTLTPAGYVWNPSYLVAGLLALLVGLWRRNLLLIVIVGVATVAIVRACFNCP